MTTNNDSDVNANLQLNRQIKVLVLDDEVNFTEEIEEFLQANAFISFTANNVQKGRSILKTKDIDLLILDVRLKGISGLDVLKEVKAEYPKLEVIIVSAHGDMETVIKALRYGAIDYLKKPFRLVDIQIAIQKTKKFIDLQRTIKNYEETNSLISKNLQEKIKRDFIGESPQIKEILDMAMTAAKYPDTSVLVTGESGTGKENVARIIHYESDRKNNVFCAVNSSAISESLLESEFFGHKKGSFTGAISDKKGFFEVSNEGTLFLDEIADMPINLQAKILRAIEEKTITRVGETEPIATDFRIIAATNHDLEKLIKQKKFRLDLLHRLNTIHIHIPPLRERTADIEPLLDHFVAEFARKLNKPVHRVDKETVKMLKNYSFPGNVRELRNMTERAIILCKGDVLTVMDFQTRLSNEPDYHKEKIYFNLEENESNLIRLALKLKKYNQKKTAEILGITRDSLIRRMKKYGIHVNKIDNFPEED
ncbi:MAG: sigma-54-dependent Fis family transcriptional regulator [Verrucomicrobia bacterium]|nr:sigma-54-dependent Fis family transcriptional regulator [Prolixibacteraceae bacterium]